MPNQEPRLPRLGEFVREYGVLYSVEMIPPPPPTVNYIFVYHTATIKCKAASGKTIAHYNTFNDWGGLDTCVPKAIEEAKQKMAEFNTPGLIFEVTKHTEYVRKEMVGDAKNHYHVQEFVELRDLKIGCKANVPEETSEVVWSSAWEGNAGDDTKDDARDVEELAQTMRSLLDAAEALRLLFIETENYLNHRYDDLNEEYERLSIRCAEAQVALTALGFSPEDLNMVEDEEDGE